MIDIGTQRLVELINFTKDNLIEEDPLSSVSILLSSSIVVCQDMDSVLFTNEMNKYHSLDKDITYFI